MKNETVYLDHIVECIEWIERHTAEGKEVFLKDRKTQSAVLREIQTLAESSQRLSDDLKNAHSEILWQAIAGLRNILVHDYLGIKMERIWEIIQRDLPSLRNAVKSMQANKGKT